MYGSQASCLQYNTTDDLYRNMDEHKHLAFNVWQYHYDTVHEIKTSLLLKYI